LSSKYSADGVRVILINTLGKHDNESIGKIVRLNNPIIEDDGTISSLFKANIYDTIIIGKDQKIKFKYSRPDNRVIFNQVMTILGVRQNKSINSYSKALLNSFNKIKFININSAQLESLSNVIIGKKAVINISISSCFGCPESKRVNTLKNLSKTVDDNIILVYLFGEGNSKDIIKEVSERLELTLSNILVGVIQRDGNMTDDEYFDIFRLNVDPSLFVINEMGRLIFIEKEGEASKIDQNYLTKYLQ
jgi:hypothetical protein